MSDVYPWYGMPLCPHKVQFDCEYGCQRRPDWEDLTAPPNGIGPVCKHCHNLIDSPSDHKMDCSVKPEPAEPVVPVHEVKSVRMMVQIDVPVLNTWERLGMTDTVMRRLIDNLQADLMYYNGTATLLGQWDRPIDED